MHDQRPLTTGAAVQAETPAPGPASQKRAEIAYSVVWSPEKLKTFVGHTLTMRLWSWHLTRAFAVRCNQPVNSGGDSLIGE